VYAHVLQQTQSSILKSLPFNNKAGLSSTVTCKETEERRISHTIMSAPNPDSINVRTVQDGRIRKGWPFTRSGGPLRYNLRSRVNQTKGLRNPGVLCYRNSVLQCLLHVPEFFRFLDKADRCPTPGDGCVFCALRSFALRYWTSADDTGRENAVTMVNTAMENHPGLNPDDRQRYWFLRPSMRSSGQQDAHEYFLGVVNMLEHHQDKETKEKR
jgi:ubiquitin C-terminal hydrolase